MREYWQWRDPRVALLNILLPLSLCFAGELLCLSARHAALCQTTAVTNSCLFAIAVRMSVGSLRPSHIDGVLFARESALPESIAHPVCCQRDGVAYTNSVREQTCVVSPIHGGTACISQTLNIFELYGRQHQHRAAVHNTFSCEKPPTCSIQRYDILVENRLEKVPVALLPFHSLRGACTHTFVLGSMYLCCMRVYERDCVRVCVARFSDSGLSSRQIPCHRTSSKL